jgi:hypothetical protein
MDEALIPYLTAGLMVAYFLVQVVTRRFDPFAPTWLFLVGYAQIHVIQALNYHAWGVSVRGKDLVAAADWRALWGLAWFLAIYHLGLGRRLAAVLPRPPSSWSPGVVAMLAPPLILWGLFCAGVVARSGPEDAQSAEASLVRSFPFVLMVAAIMLLVTGRMNGRTKPAFQVAGLLASAAYVLIWMFNGKRSHSLMAVLATMCALYVTRQRRPSWAALGLTAVAGAMVVGIAISWRNDRDHERSFAGFARFLADFRASRVLESMNISDGEGEVESYETSEYGGFLLMLDTVPQKSGYDHGECYLRVISTFIPRLLWPSKPLYGRPQWIAAWQAGSEMEREDDFTGPSIGLMGAAQLNGGAWATAVVLACAALLLRGAYDYFMLHSGAPWVQFWWAITFFNAWFMVVGDNPLTWFYLNWGYSAFPIVVLLWLANRSGGRDRTEAAGPPMATAILGA